MLNKYYDAARVARLVATGRHRDAVGGAWDEIGQLQLRFLVERGLRPHHRLLDIGCGSLRAGIHFVDYLERNHYFGTDLSESLLDAGYTVELSEAGKQKLPRGNLICNGDFVFDWAQVKFDFAIAQSVFTHLPLAYFRTCLERLTAVMQPGGMFFATLFDVPETHPLDEPFTQRHGRETHRDADPYHAHVSDVVRLCDDLPWRPSWIGEWGHPRFQRIIQFENVM